MNQSEFRILIEDADAALAASDLNRLMGFYADDATLVLKPGDVVIGRDAIVQALRSLAASSRQMVRRGRIEVVEAGDVALAMVETRWDFPAPKGYELSRTGTATFVFKKTGCRWSCVVDNALGSALIPGEDIADARGEW